VREWVIVFLKGVAMGAADTVPGVSGGTIALITGVYERFVRALTELHPAILRHVASLTTRDGRRRFVAELRRMDAVFLVVLGLGVITSIVTLSRVVHAALVGFRAQTFAFFFGLIAASAFVLYSELTLDTVGRASAGVAGVVIALVISGAAVGGAFGHSLPVVFLAGSVAITAMVLPGISGSFILILLGQYEYLTGVLTSFVDRSLATLTGGGADGLVSLASVISVFGVGAVVGLLSVAHAITWALEHYREATLVFLVSLMVGSLRLPILEIRENIGAWTPAAVGSVVVTGVVGAGAVLLLDYYTADLSEVTS
jgi:putative membrane protein